MNIQATPIHETGAQDAVLALWTALMQLTAHERLTARGVAWVNDNDRYECPCCNQWVPSGHFGP